MNFDIESLIINNGPVFKGTAVAPAPSRDSKGTRRPEHGIRRCRKETLRGVTPSADCVEHRGTIAGRVDVDGRKLPGDVPVAVEGRMERENGRGGGGI
jgi:hypothetical protein